MQKYVCFFDCFRNKYGFVGRCWYDYKKWELIYTVTAEFETYKECSDYCREKNGGKIITK